VSQSVQYHAELPPPECGRSGRSAMDSSGFVGQCVRLASIRRRCSTLEQQRCGDAPARWQCRLDVSHLAGSLLFFSCTCAAITAPCRVVWSQITLPSVVDNSVLFLDGGLSHTDILFAKTRNGVLYALDARNNGAVLWFKAHTSTTCLEANGAGGNTNPCTTPGSPAIDPNRQYMYQNIDSGRYFIFSFILSFESS
jgi:hypothetical protein